MGALTLPRPTLRPWRRLRSEPVGSYRVFDVCQVELEDAERRPRGDAFTIRCNDWCNVVAITPDDHVVLVWQYRFGTDALSLEIPGGVVDAGETPEEAARRELLEESGYRAADLEPLLVVEPNPAIQSNRCFTFLAREAVPTGTTCFDSQEELETALVPAGRIGDLLDGGQVTHALVQGALEVYRRKRDDAPPPRATTWPEVEQLLEELEEQQRCRVLELARRLRPGLTLEDLRNPHDFRELDDGDWQHEDGVFAGVQGVLAAVRARARERGGRR
jgi:ADP-ribose pyrophosphatase